MDRITHILEEERDKWIKDVSDLGIEALCNNIYDSWSGDVYDFLKEGNRYKVIKIRMSTNVTYIYLEGHEDRFNSVNFEFFKNEQTHDIYQDRQCWSDALIKYREKLLERYRIDAIFSDSRLVDAFKISNTDENGYSAPCPVVWYDYSFTKDENGVLFLNNVSTCVTSNLYTLFLDEESIIYDFNHRRLLIFKPTEKMPRMAFKGFSWIKAVKLSPNYEGNVDLSQLYYDIKNKISNYNTDKTEMEIKVIQKSQSSELS